MSKRSLQVVTAGLGLSPVLTGAAAMLGTLIGVLAVILSGELAAQSFA